MKKQIAALFVFLLVLLFAALPVSAALRTQAVDIPAGGLWFPFDGNAEEASGVLSGKLRGNPGFVEGRDGTPNGAIRFETDAEAVELLCDDYEGDAWTASFWVKPETFGAHVFLCSSMTGSLRVIQDNGMVGATMNGVVDKSVPYTIPLDTWTMLTYVYDGDMELTSVYVNGEFFDGMYGIQTLPLTLIGNDAPEQKGWQSEPHLALDDTWFFPRALTDAEIMTLFETNTPPPVPEPEPEEPEPEPEPEAPETPEEPGSEDSDDLEETDEEDFPQEDPAAENPIREKKPGAVVGMAAVLLVGLFLLCAGARAIFGRSTK